MSDVRTVDLDSLVGLHDLSGCDTLVEKVESYCGPEDANVIRFVLDGTTYTAIEDPDDGYRSCMKKIFADSSPVQNTFPAVKVIGRKKADNEAWYKNDILELIDVVTGKTVLEVGTGNLDDYYPYFEGKFNPENMATNAA